MCIRDSADPEHQGDYFYAYETIYRNVPEKYKDYFNTESMKMKILKFCDWNYKDMATNHTNVSRIELIEQDQYYTSYMMCLVRLVTMRKIKKECLTTTVNVMIDNL